MLLKKKQYKQKMIENTSLIDKEIVLTTPDLLRAFSSLDLVLKQIIKF